MEDDAQTGNFIRLTKALSEWGICSRREAEKWIEEEKIRVNSKLAVLGEKIDIDNLPRITINGKPINTKAPQSVTLLMNKPKGYLCSNKDPHETKTVFSLLPPEYRRYKLACAGRLDKDSEGMLILTNNGTLANQLMHPRHQIIKRYKVTVNRAFDTTLIPRLLKGIYDEGEHLYAVKVIPAKTGPDHEKQIEMHLDKGRKREIRRLLKAFGFFVKRLERFQIGDLQMKRLTKGSVKLLAEKEIRLLTKNNAEAPLSKD